VISLNLSNHALPSDYRTDDEEMLLIMLRILSDEIGDAFFDIDKETRKNAANAKPSDK